MRLSSGLAFTAGPERSGVTSGRSPVECSGVGVGVVCHGHAPRPGQVQELELRSSRVPLGDAPLHTQPHSGRKSRSTRPRRSGVTEVPRKEGSQLPGTGQ